MPKFLRAAFLVAFAVTPLIATAQGGRGGMGGDRGRGRRGQSDSAPATAPRPQLSFADIVFAHRAQLQLSDSQAVKVGNIRMIAMSRRATLSNEVDSVKATLVVTPGDGSAPPTDSSRKVMAEGRRMLASMLGELHDVDVTARNETLALLNPAQQQTAAQLEATADSPQRPTGPVGSSSEHGGRGGRGGRGGGTGGP